VVNQVTSYTGGTVPANTWVQGTVNLAGFAAGTYDGFWFQDSTGGTATPEVYVDSITVVGK